MTASMVHLAWGDPTETRVVGERLLLIYSGFLDGTGKLIRSPAGMEGLEVEVSLQKGIVINISETNRSTTSEPVSAVFGA